MKNLRRGGTWIFVQEKLYFLNVNLASFCKEQDLKVCAVKLPIQHGNICILSIHRALSSNLSSFLLGLEAILKSLYNTKLELILCGDINVNYIVDNNNNNKNN
jgi:hypothetical protein